jgi:hypothetical protein
LKQNLSAFWQHYNPTIEQLELPMPCLQVIISGPQAGYSLVHLCIASIARLAHCSPISFERSQSIVVVLDYGNAA